MSACLLVCMSAQRSRTSALPREPLRLRAKWVDSRQRADRTTSGSGLKPLCPRCSRFITLMLRIFTTVFVFASLVTRHAIKKPRAFACLAHPRTPCRRPDARHTGIVCMSAQRSRTSALPREPLRLRAKWVDSRQRADRTTSGSGLKPLCPRCSRFITLMLRIFTTVFVFASLVSRHAKENPPKKTKRRFCRHPFRLPRLPHSCGCQLSACSLLSLASPPTHCTQQRRATSRMYWTTRRLRAMRSRTRR